jgi:LacI family transcriptional regulator
VYASLKDIAARAGVSFQTASKVLNGGGNVKPETRERILAAARELGYVPNAVARGLIAQSTRTVGILADDLADWVLAQFVVGAEREARRQGHAVLIGTLDRTTTGGAAAGQARLLIERRVDGLIAATPQVEQDESVAELLRGRIPVVSMYHVPGRGVPVVGSHHRQTGQLATEHLARLGHRRIATITGPETRRVVATRLRGWRLALTAAGLEPDPDLVEEADWTADGGYHATHRLLDRAGDVTAVFAQNDMMAVGVLAALHDRGLAVPGDVAVVGCDDLPMVARTIPPLTTVRIPTYETGEHAVRLLLDLIAGRGHVPDRVLLPVQLVVRASCGATRPSPPADGPAQHPASDPSRET